MRTIDVTTPRGALVTIAHRDDTTDLSTIGAIFRLWGLLHDEYGFAEQHPETFLDIGGHIGLATIAVLVDNPACRAVIVEPLPENCDMIRHNLALAGIADRATVIEGAIGAGAEQRVGYTLARVQDAPDIHRYVGSPVTDDYAGEAITVPTYPLGDLIDLLGDTVDLGKIDCEGCEWVALADPEAARVRLWVGEYHGQGAEALTTLLDGTHRVTTAPHDHGATGMFTAAIR